MKADPENEYVKLHELQNRLARLEKEQQAQAEEEKRRLKEAHWMHCPKCGQELVTEKLDVVEIDVCPSCKGIWLDAGELGAIVEQKANFFHSCLRALRVSKDASPHLQSKPATSPGS